MLAHGTHPTAWTALVAAELALEARRSGADDVLNVLGRFEKGAPAGALLTATTPSLSEEPRAEWHR
jgi:hypothetical protein